MGIFGKLFRRNDEVIDLTMMQKRGLLKVPEEKEYAQLGQEQSAQSQGSDMGFLSSMAGSAETSSSASSSATEEKLNNISDKIYNIMQRMELIEKKIERVEIRTGIKNE